LDELTFQEELKQEIQEALLSKDKEGRVWQGNEFKNTEKGKWLTRPDLILESTKLPFKHIGIECKTGKKFHDVSKGVIHQVQSRYIGGIYEIRETSQNILIDTMCFTTIPAIKTGTAFYGEHHAEASKFFVERIINQMNYIQEKFNYCSLTKMNGEFLFYYKNRRYKLDGTYFTVCDWRD